MSKESLIDDLKEKLDYYIKLNVQLTNTIDMLKLENENLQKQLQDIKLANSRNAGRKNKFSDMEIEMIKMYRFQGKKIQELAEMFGCSVGLISKICS